MSEDSELDYKSDPQIRATFELHEDGPEPDHAKVLVIDSVGMKMITLESQSVLTLPEQMLEQGHSELGFPENGVMIEEDFPEDECVVDPDTGFPEELAHEDEPSLGSFSQEEIDRIKDAVRIMKSHGIEI